MNVLFVGIGGFIGSVGRYLLTVAMNKSAPFFPFGVLLSNILASLLIGFIIGIDLQTEILPERTKLFLTTGLLGGLSTFSTFTMDTVILFEKGKYLMAAGNILFNLAFCLIFVVIGMAIARNVAK